MAKAGRTKKAGETRKKEEIERTEDAFFAGMTYSESIKSLIGQIERFQDVDEYTKGARRIFQKTSLTELRMYAHSEYHDSCRIQESCRQMARQWAPRNRSLRDRLIYLKSELDSSYNTLNEFLEGSMKYA